MKHNNGPLIICVAWIAAWVWHAYSEIGTVYECPSEPVSGLLPIMMLGLMGLPSLFAYLHGKNVGRAKHEGGE